MPLDIPPELKKISPYIRRAEELDKDPSPESRLVAYYCRQYAVHVGIPLSNASPNAKQCLGELLENLESEKPAMDNFTRDEAAYLCRMFANRVFDKANDEDRSGNADKTTAKTFYAASTFLQILEQFSDDNDSSEEHAEDRKRIVYAKWKSTDILKAIKEGRTPTPGGYGEEEEEEEDDAEKKEDASMNVLVETVTSDDEGVGQEDFGIPPAAPSGPPIPPPEPESEDEESPVHVYVPTDEQDDHRVDDKAEEAQQEDEEELGTEVELGPPPAYPGEPETGSSFDPSPPKVTFNIPPPVEPPAPVVPVEPKKTGFFGFGGKKKGGHVTKAQLADAVELTRFALAALEDKDSDLGAERLQQALQALGR